MSTVKATNLQHASATSPNITLGSDGSVAVGGGNISPSIGMRNRIINGDMRIDQRNGGAAVVGTGFSVDRFYNAATGSNMTQQRSPVAPTGFTNSLSMTVNTATAPGISTLHYISQTIEGFNVADMDFGKASAVSFTLSFWVRSSVVGTYTVGLLNGAQNRSYVTTYTINSAGTWEYKTITVSGDTAGTWLTDNGKGLCVFWDLGSGSNFQTTAGSWQAGTFLRTSGSANFANNTGATFYLTGVQVEKGSVATPFEFRSVGQELALCQRYFETSFATGFAPGTVNLGVADTGAFALYGSYTASLAFPFKVKKRATATVTMYAPLDSTSVGRVRRADNGNINTVSSPFITHDYANFNVDSGVAGALYQFGYTASAEL